MNKKKIFDFLQFTFRIESSLNLVNNSILLIRIKFLGKIFLEKNYKKSNIFIFCVFQKSSSTFRADPSLCVSKRSFDPIVHLFSKFFCGKKSRGGEKT